MKSILFKVAKLFPKTTGGRIVAAIGYLTVIAGIALTVNYLLVPLSLNKCDADTRNVLLVSSIVIGLIQLLLAAGFGRMVWALTRRNGIPYKILILALAFVLFFGQLLFIIGYGFGMGTACTT